MNNTCEILNDIYQRLKDGEDIEKLIPYDMTNLNEDLRLELMILYKTHGKNKRRLEVIDKWFAENE